MDFICFKLRNARLLLFERKCRRNGDRCINLPLPDTLNLATADFLVFCFPINVYIIFSVRQRPGSPFLQFSAPWKY